jgi:hypothetical protein
MLRSRCLIAYDHSISQSLHISTSSRRTATNLPQSYPQSITLPRLSSNMTTLLLGCGALCSDRLKLRYDTRKQDKIDYANRFEELKAENAKRQSFIDSFYQTSEQGSLASASEKSSQRTQSTPVGAVLPRLPSYEDATLRSPASSVRSYASSRTSSTDSQVTRS